MLATYSRDGYYYEGFEHWIFATPWIIRYLNAQKHATGEDLFDQPGLKLTYLYAAHSLTPGGEMMFDFGDVFAGPTTRARTGEDYERSHPNGHLLAQRLGRAGSRNRLQVRPARGTPRRFSHRPHA